MRELPLIAICALSAAAQQKPSAPHVRATTPSISGVADWKLVDLDHKPGVELFVVSHAGEISTFSFAQDAVSRGETGHVQDPAHCAIALEPLAPDGPIGLFVASPRGVERFEADEKGAFPHEPVVLDARAKMRVRTGQPMFAPLARDVNGDGRMDLIVPNGRGLDVWIQGVATQPPPHSLDAKPSLFTKAATVQVRVSSNESMDGNDLSDDLESSLLIPGLRMEDVNGDGRADLVVEDGEKRAFHLVRADGSIPSAPDVSVDLAIFRDTTPRADLVPGQTLAGSDKAVWVSRDLDGDGIPDYVIAHRRKVWVFHGSSIGPQFTEPSTILKAADDVTAVLVANLDDDGKPDLVLVRVQVPSLATLLRGLVASWRIQVDAVGYKNSGGRKFETTPQWKSELSFEVPAILTIIKDPEKILSRFEDVGKKFRSPAEGDFDGDGASDVALLSEDGTRIDVWRGNAATAVKGGESDDAVLKQVLFQDENKDWDIERLVGWLSTFGERRVALVTGGREPDVKWNLRDAKEWNLVSIAPADIDGDGRIEIVLRYDSQKQEKTTQFDVVSWQ